MHPTRSDRGLGFCLAAFAARLLLPAAYVAAVTVYPIARFDVGVGAALLWILISVFIVPTSVLILVLRGRRRPKTGEWARRVG